MTKVYGDFGAFWRVLAAKNKAKQSQTKPNKANFRRDDVFYAEGLRLPQSLRSFAMTLVGYLKKQSQFFKGQNYIKSISIMVYGDLDG